MVLDYKSSHGNYNYGIISKLNRALDPTLEYSSVDWDPENVLRLFSKYGYWDPSSTSGKISYGILPEGSYFIDIKFRQYSSGSSTYLKFKMLAEKVASIVEEAT